MAKKLRDQQKTDAERTPPRGTGKLDADTSPRRMDERKSPPPPEPLSAVADRLRTERDDAIAKLRDLGLTPRMDDDEPAYMAARVDFHPELRVIVRGHDFENPVVGNGIALTVDRAGSVATAKPFVRRSPCMMVFTELQVELDGTVVPCCNIRTDNPEHRPYAVGRIGHDADIFQVWSGTALAEWRRRLSASGRRTAPVPRAITPSSWRTRARLRPSIRRRRGLAWTRPDADFSRKRSLTLTGHPSRVSPRK